MGAFTSTIQATLGLDTKPFDDGLKNAAARSEAAGKQIARGNDAASASHEKLLTSTHRTGARIARFSHEMAMGANATDLFSAGLEGLGRSLNLSLGAIAALEVGGVVVGRIGEVISEYKKLNKEVDDLISKPRTNAISQTLQAIQQDSEKVTEALKKVTDEQKGGFGQWLKDNITHAGALLTGLGPAAAGEERRKQVSGLEAASEADDRSAAQKMKRSRDIAGSGEPDFIKKADELQDRFLEAYAAADEKHQGHIAYELTEALKDAFESLAEKVASANKEKSQLSLGELAQSGVEIDRGQFGVGHFAREAVKEQGLARQEALLGHLPEAQAHTARAEEIKSGISTLKDSEKDKLVALGTDQVAILKMIETNTKGRAQIVNQ